MIRSPLKRHGGKSYLLKWILENTPPYAQMFEPFCGSAIVSLNCTGVRVVNDADPGIVAVLVALKDGSLRPALQHVECCEQTFLKAQREMNTAVDYCIVNRMSRGGMGKDFSQSTRLRGGVVEHVNCWETMIDQLPEAEAAMQEVAVLYCDGIGLLRQPWKAGTHAYCDPPYVKDTRTAKKAYGTYDWSDQQHMSFLDAALAWPGTMMISGYANPLYDTMLEGWTRKTREIANHSGQGATKQRRTEVLWMNYV